MRRSALAGEFVGTQIGAVFTLGADEAALPEEIGLTREAVNLALNYLEGELMGKLIGIAVQDITAHLSRSLVSLLDVGLPVAMEAQSLRMSYSELRNTAQKISGHASETEDTGDRAYRENASRDIEDSGEGGDDNGDGGGWRAVLRAVEQALLDIARVLFKILTEAIASIQRATAGVIMRMIDKLEETDDAPASDLPGDDVPTTPVSSDDGPVPPGAGDRVPETDRASKARGSEKAQAEGVTRGDPVDVATGDVVLAETDVTLPGVLPLVLERTHRSSRRTGRWFGRSWLSSFDQRLQVTADRIIGVFADGRLLTWASPDGLGDDPLLPLRGPAWQLRRNADGSYAVTDPQRGLTWRFERRAGYSSGPGDQGELPLVSLTDRIGHEIAFSYDAAGQPVAVAHSGGYRVLVTMTNGHVAALTLAGHDGAGDVPLRRFTYDLHGNLSGVINSSGKPLRFTYDCADRLTGWLDRNGHYYRYVYDSEGRCIAGEGPGGALSGTFTYEPGRTSWTDIAGAVTSYELTDSGDVATITDPLGNVARSEYDSRGRLTTHIDPLGRITRYAYDLVGNVTTITRPDGGQVTAEYDEQSQPVMLSQPDGNVWRQEYDASGNRTRLIAPDGTAMAFRYERGHLAQVTSPDVARTEVVCDAAGLPVEVAGPGSARARYERDLLGGVTQVTAPDGGTTRLDRMPDGRPISRIFPDGAVESWDWDPEGNLARYVNASGAITSYEFGPFDKVTAIRWPDGTRSDFRYDHSLSLTEVVHAGLTWRYDYDLTGRLVAETDYNGATTAYAYDAAGQLTRQVNAVGQEITYNYDALGNLTEYSGEDSVTAFGYDRVGRLLQARNPDAELVFVRDDLGRVTAETCNGRTVRLEYDAAGRITRRVTPSGSVTDWEFDETGLPVAMIADGHQMRFVYNAAGQEIRRELPGGLTLTQEWDQRGRLVGQSLAGSESGSEQSHQLPTGLPEEREPFRQLLQRRMYSYRADGFPDRIDDLLAGDRVVTLDLIGRVTAITGSNWIERYSYDQVGNVAAVDLPGPLPGVLLPMRPVDSEQRRQVTGTLITQAGDIHYRHDRAGRVITRQRTRVSRKPDTWHYQWSADNRLTAVSTPDGATWRYRYDPLGRRIAKQRIDSAERIVVQTIFAWDGPVLIEQTDAVGFSNRTITWEYRPGTFHPVVQTSHSTLSDASQDEIEDRFYAIITDLAGAPSELATPEGELALRQRSTLWGADGPQPRGIETPLRFAGQFEDAETGLHYNHHRYYDPNAASYLSPDPLGLSPAPNHHAYVSNPHVQSDPLGLKGATCPGGYYPEAIAARNRAEQLERLTGYSGNTIAVIGIRNMVTGEIYERVTLLGYGKDMPKAWKGSVDPYEWFPNIEDYHSEETIFETHTPYEKVIYGGTSTNVCEEICAKQIRLHAMTLGGQPLRTSRPGINTQYRTFWQTWRG